MALDRSAIKNPYLTIGGKATSVAKLNDDQIRQAILGGQSGALSDGWEVRNGQIVRKGAGGGPQPGVGGGPAASSSSPAPAAGRPISQVTTAIKAAAKGAIRPAAAAVAPARPGVGRVAAGTPAPTYAPSSFHYVTRNGQRVAVRYDRMTAAERARLPQLGGGGGGGGAAGGGGDSPSAPITPGPDVMAPEPEAPRPVIPAPSWIGALFPTIGVGGVTTNPSGGATSFAGPNFAQQLAEWGAASAVDPSYAAAYSGALSAAMGDVAPLQSEAQGLLAVDPTTGQTRYQSELGALNRVNQQNISSVYGSAAARGIEGSGMVDNNLAKNAAWYTPQTAQLSGTYGDARLAELSRQIARRILGLNMDLVGAYQTSSGQAYQNLPSLVEAYQRAISGIGSSAGG